MKQSMRRILGVVGALLLVSVLAAGMGVQAQEPTARTYYESLKLDTPEDAVKTFTDAFARQDFATVFMVFAPDAQQAWQAALTRFSFDRMVKPEYKEHAKDHLTKYDDIESWDISQMFDTFMLGVAKNDGLSIDLRGKTTIGTNADAVTKDDEPAIDVTTTVEGIEGDVVFRMVQSPSKRWRVLQVITEGGDEKRLPWSIPPNSTS